MSPIRISPEGQVYISSDPETLSQTEPTTESRVVKEEVFVLPCGKKEDHVVRVEGFSNSPGGIVETERLTAGHTKDDITLTTSEDPELSGELGVTAVTIDRVLYEATNVEEDRGRGEALRQKCLREIK